MPLGSFRLNSLGRYIAAGGGASIDSAFSLSNHTFKGSLYQIPQISYAGDDSSGQPVFFMANTNTGGAFACVLIKYKSDDTIEESTVRVLRSFDAGWTNYECQGIAGFDTTGNPIGVSVATLLLSGTTRSNMYVNDLDLDAMTIGSSRALNAFNDITPTAGFAYSTYLGNGRFAGGYRGSGIRSQLVSVASGAAASTIGSETTESYGDGVWQGLYGVEYQSDNDYRWLSANGNSNQHGAAWSTTTPQGSVISDTLTTGLGKTQPFEFGFDKMLNVAYAGGGAQMVVSDITWPASGSPSLTTGSLTTFSDSANWNGGFAGATDRTTDTVYIVHKHSTNGWQIRPITASGTTPVEDTAISVGATTTNWGTNGEDIAACFANSEAGNIVATVVEDTTSNNPQIYFKSV